MLTERIDRARDLCRQWVHDGHTPTLGVCVARRGVIILHEALDMTTFGHMFLNRGRFGGARILSLAAVAAMTRDQVPGIGARFFERVMPHASWGYGWQIESPTKWPYFHGSLQPLGTFSHPGAGGTIFWIDRVHELVGAYFEVVTSVTEKMDHLWKFDLFQNLITSAVAD